MRDIHEDIRDIDGWLMPAEVEALYRIGRRHGSVIFEIGTFRGKSATVLLRGATGRWRWRRPQFFSLDINPGAGPLAEINLERRGLAQTALFFHGPIASFRKQFAISPTMAFVDGDHTYN